MKHDLCADNVICCDDNCQRCAKLIYERYMEQKEKEKGKWIDVNDAMPEDYNDREMVCLIVRNNQVMYARRDFLIFKYIWNADEYGFSIVPDEEVTHWMPLPEPPNVEKEDVE